MVKNVLVLHASPRMEGNSNALAEMFIAGAEAAGHVVSRINLGHADIRPCLACDHCRRDPDICIQNDDMQQLYPAIKGADCVAFAAPLYYYGLPAQLKVMLDRLHALGLHIDQIRDKESVLMMTAADKSKSAFDAAVKNYELACLKYLRWQNRGVLLAPGMDAAGDIKDDPLLAEAYILGHGL